LNFYFSNIEMEKETDPKKLIKSHAATIGKYNTIINHLESLPNTWEYLQEHFKTSKTSPNLTHSEINFAEFQTLNDEHCLYL